MLKASQKAAYNYLKPEEQTKEVLITDNGFVDDAKTFLIKREGYSPEDLATPEDVYDAYMEHFRYQDVNEVTAIRDLQYAQNSNQEEKDRFARLTMLYDTKEGEGFFDAAGDYFQGIATAPSTYLGIASGGAGKLATVAGLKAAKQGLKKILYGSVKKSVLRGGAVEGSIGALQGTAQEMAKVESGYKDEVDYGNIALTTGISAVTGGAVSGLAGTGQTVQALRASKKLDVAQVASEKIAKEANTKAKAVLEKATIEQKKFISDKLKALDPEKVALGKNLTDKIAKEKELGTLKAGLPLELFENISAAALEIQAALGKKGLKFRKGDRITTVLQRAIAEGDIETAQVNKILQDYNLTADQFSLVYKAELSEAGKILNVQSQLVKAIEGLSDEGFSTMTGREAKEIIDTNKAGSYLFSKRLAQDIDRVRLGFMTSQPATTMRNNFAGGFRMAVDMTTRTIDNILNQKVFGGTRNFKDILDAKDLALYAFNPYEARVTRLLLEQGMPDTARKLFREAADLAATTGGESKLAKLGAKVNVLNTASDNFFKQAMLSASLKRRLSDQGQDLSKIIEEGKFNLIDKKTINGAIEDALEFTYQSGFYGKRDETGLLARGTQGLLRTHREVPFLISSAIPFPRFIANQLKFLHDHAPVLGMIPLENIGKKVKPKYGAKEFFTLQKGEARENFTKRLSRQITGLGMLAVAYKWREKQGENARWNEFKDDKGNFVNATAMYGPFSMFMLAADILYRYNNTDVGGERDIRDISLTDTQYWRDALQAAAGSQFRTGAGLYAIDKLTDDLTGEGDFTESKGKKILGEFVGNIVNTFMIPLSVFKDLYSPFDKQSRYVPESEGAEVDFLDIVANRGFRSLPDIGPDTALGRLLGAEEYDAPKADPFVTGSPQAIDPFEKQLAGFTKRQPKNLLQNEMSKLNLQRYDVYKRDSNPVIDLHTRLILSQSGSENNLNEQVGKLLNTYEYSSKPDQQSKRKFIINKSKEIIDRAKKQARQNIEKFSEEAGLNYSEVDVSDWRRTSSREQKDIELAYSAMIRRGILHFVDEGPKESKDIYSDRNRTIIRQNGEVMNVLRWALGRKTAEKKED